MAGMAGALRLRGNWWGNFHKLWGQHKELLELYRQHVPSASMADDKELYDKPVWMELQRKLLAFEEKMSKAMDLLLFEGDFGKAGSLIFQMRHELFEPDADDDQPTQK